MSKNETSSLLLELIIAPQHDKKVDKCPKYEGIWLDRNISKNMIDFTNEDNTMRYAQDLEDRRIHLTRFMIINFRMIITTIKNHLRKVGN
jgi:Zn-finger nucleic acid-binding protein